MTMVTVLVLMLLSAASAAPGMSGQQSHPDARASSTLDHTGRGAMAAESQPGEDEATIERKHAVKKREAHPRAKRGRKEESRASGRAEPPKHAPEDHEDAPAQPDTDDDFGVTVRLERSSMTVPSMTVGR